MTALRDVRLTVVEWLSTTVGRRLSLDVVLVVSRVQLAWHRSRGRG